jgi:hypothetical protein
MFKPSAKLALVALAVPVFGGFAAYAAAQVSTKPAPQVVIPGAPAADDKGGARKTVAPTTPNSIDDHGGRTVGSSTPTSIDDHGGRTVGSSTPTSIDDHGGRTVGSSTPSSTPTSIDDHGGSRGSGSGRDG